MNKIRVRFGVKLGLPFFQNVGVAVVYVTQPQWTQMQEAVGVIRTVLSVVAPNVNAQFVCEQS